MAMEPKLDLDPATIEAIQDLIQANLDAAGGFKEAAKEIDDSIVSSLFSACSVQRNKHASQLQYYVVRNGERARTEGTWLASLHRVWLDLRAKLSGGDPYVLLCEVERGEDHIKAAYEETLKQTAGNALSGVLVKQYASVKDEHDQMCALRKSYRQKDASQVIASRTRHRKNSN